MSYLGIARPRIQASHQPLILCSEFFNLPTMIDPCDRSSLEAAIVTKHRRGGQFGACQALSILHELLHVNHIVGPEISHLRDVLPFAALAHEHRISRFPDIKKLTEQIYKRWQPRENVNAYQLMAAWAWMSPRQKAKCPQNYRLWGILDAGSMEEVDAILPNVPLDPERDTGELRRKLLGVFWRRGPSGGA
ncbi:MAG: hypothetical protein M1814_004853 [Vezdaea aestivalis]|nr:MAG: hypothetical protein M1814_004853 [Vezdaea aestivalis]